jgi:hypothetical protein
MKITNGNDNLSGQVGQLESALMTLERKNLLLKIEINRLQKLIDGRKVPIKSASLQHV